MESGETVENAPDDRCNTPDRGGRRMPRRASGAESEPDTAAAGETDNVAECPRRPSRRVRDKRLSSIAAIDGVEHGRRALKLGSGATDEMSLSLDVSLLPRSSQRNPKLKDGIKSPTETIMFRDFNKVTGLERTAVSRVLFWQSLRLSTSRGV